MTTLTLPILWCVLQVTLLGLLTAGLYLAVRRVSPASSASVLLSGLVVAALLAVSAASPWPSWARQPSTHETTSLADPDVAAHDVPTRRLAAPEPISDSPATTRDVTHDDEGMPTSMSGRQATDTPGGAYFDRFVYGIDAMLLDAASDEPRGVVTDERVESRGPAWPGYLGITFAVAVLIGMLRFAIGWFAVRRQVARSRVLSVAALDELCAALQHELGYRRSVALRESAELATAATVGWRRPVILLPAAWSTWTADERRAVLAHELAHVARGHFALWLLAQTGLVLHFYHPLIHWLAARLRLEQEYEADALAAPLTGGPHPYLQTLARLALHQSDTHVTWPARAFLPTHRTFLRRIEMLRHTHRPWKPSFITRTLLIAVVLCGGIFAAGLRGTAEDERKVNRSAQDEPQSSNDARTTEAPFAQGSVAEEPAPVSENGLPPLSAVELALANGPIELSYIPGDAVFVIAYRPLKLQNVIQQSERLAPLSKCIYLFPVHWLSEFVEMSVVQLSLVGTPDDLMNIAREGGEALMPTTIHQRLPSAPLDLSQHMEGAEERAFGRTRYYCDKDGHPAWFTPDEHTVVWSQYEDQLLRLIANGPQVRSEIVKSSDWQTAAEEAHAAVAVNLEMLGRLLPVELSPYLAILTPIWESGDNAVASAQIQSDRVLLRLVVNCRSEEGTQGVRETLAAIKRLNQNMLEGLGKQAVPHGTDPLETAMFRLITSVPQALMASAQIESAGNQVVVTASHEIDAELVQLLLKVIENAQTVAKQQSDLDDLKQLGLALHNYHDTHLQFPPAVVVDKESGVSRSWRIEILPFVGETRLYYHYRKDEPWDSEHNKQILAQMPDCFRSTGMPSDATETRYLAPVGLGTAFDPAKPIRIRDISDGTSNTLMIVQSPQESVPWTKPDDLPVNLAVSQGGGDEFGFGGFGSDYAGVGAASGSFLLDAATQQLNLGGLEKAGFLAVFCDGTVAALKSGIARAVLRQLLCRADGYPINAADYLDKSEIERRERLRSSFGTAAQEVETHTQPNN